MLNSIWHPGLIVFVTDSNVLVVLFWRWVGCVCNRFKCTCCIVLKVSGLPNPEIMWLLNGRPIYPDYTHRMLVRENGIHSLVIDPLTQNDAGTYTCIASNKAGQSSFCLELRVVGEIATAAIYIHLYKCIWKWLLKESINLNHRRLEESNYIMSTVFVFQRKRWSTHPSLWRSSRTQALPRAPQSD